MRPSKENPFFLLYILLFIMAGAAGVGAADLSSVTVKAASLVPGEATRYIIKFKTEEPLDLSKGTRITIELPKGFNIKQDHIMSADPGCTLAKLEYKNPGDRFYSVVRGATSIKKTSNGVQCTFILRAIQSVIPPHTDLFLTLPGVVNVPVTGRYLLNLMVQDDRGVGYQGAGQFILGLPPTAAPQQVQLVEASSHEIRLAWDPVPKATRYRVLFSSQPAGHFISAMDLAREPYPGEDWALTDTTHGFRGRGNGGLVPGRTYFFKVQAGNETGFGPSSKILPVTLPEIKPIKDLPGGKQTKTLILPGNILFIRLDQPVRIADQDAIKVYEKSSGVNVRNVHVMVDEIDNNKIRISTKAPAGQEYLVVFYEGALESLIKPNVVNNTFGWTAMVADGE